MCQQLRRNNTMPLRCSFLLVVFLLWLLSFITVLILFLIAGTPFSYFFKAITDPTTAPLHDTLLLATQITLLFLILFTYLLPVGMIAFMCHDAEIESCHDEADVSNDSQLHKCCCNTMEMATLLCDNRSHLQRQ